MTLILDGQKIKNREDLYEAVRDQLELPEYFGENLDALYDVFSETSEVLSLTVRHFSALASALGDRYLVNFFRVVTDSAGHIKILS